MLALLLTGSLGGAAQPALPAARPTFTAAPGLGDSIYPRLGDPGLDVQHYDLSLSFTPGRDSLRGRAVLTVLARTPLTQINLDWLGPAATGTKLNGQAVPSRTQDGKLELLAPAPIAAGETVTITVAYSGAPGLRMDNSAVDGLRLGWITQGAGSYALSEPDGARTYFPCNDHPSDPATFSVHLDLPAGVGSAASGELTGERRVGDRVRRDYELRQPVPTYALGIVTGQLDLVTRPGPAGVTLRDAFQTGSSAAVRAPFGRHAQMISTFASWFGPYPFGSYGVAVTEDPGIPALETATLSTFPGRIQSETVSAHELAHQWFGDAVTLGDWSETWLNEGFATYAELLWAEATQDSSVEGSALAPPQRYIENWYSRLQARGSRPLVATQASQLFDSSAYVRGALALQALRGAVGDAQFRQLLVTYVARYRGRSVRTSDLLGVVREVSGEAGVAALRPWTEDAALPPRPAWAPRP